MAYGLKYYINYYQGNQLKSCELHQRDYTGPSTLLKHTGHPVEISYLEGPKYETFKSSKAVISLLAGNGFTASELYTEDEREWLVICKHNGGQVFWKGFVLPDGCEEDFTASENYVVQVNAVDGLGLLKNLSFVREDGNIWVGKMAPKDIIWNCLNRLQIPGMALNTLVEVYEESMSETGDPLTQSLLQLETYFLSDATTPMNCQEVLESVLNTVGGGAQIIQSEGEWYVFQMDTLAAAGTKSFFKYSATTGAYVGKVSKAATVNISGHGTAIHHVFAEQKKRTDRAFKQATIKYQYGFATGLVENPSLISNGSTLSGWTIGPETLPVGEAVTLHVTGGVSLGCDGLNPDNNWIKPTSGIAVGAGEKYTVKIIFNNAGYVLGARAQVKLGSTYLQEDGSWTTTPHIMEYLNQKVNPDWHNPDIEPRPPRYVAAAIEKEWTINTESTNVSGSLNITLYEYAFDDAQEDPFRSGTVFYRMVDIVSAIDKDGQPLGEFYRAENPGNCTFILEAKTVYNADDTSAIYVGTIYRADGVTPTLNWHRKGISESKPLLSIVAENMLRMHQRPFTIYEGAVKGYFAPLSRFTVTGIDGALMMVAADYDTSEEITKLLLIQIDNAPIPGAGTVTIEYDYGQYGNSGSGSSGGGYSGGGSNVADYLTEGEANTKYYPLSSNPSGYLNTSALASALAATNDFVKNTSTLQSGAQFSVSKARIADELFIPASGLSSGQKARIKFSNAAGTGGETPPPPLTEAVWGEITGLLSAQTDLQAALNGKAALSHTHTIANVTGLQAALDGKAASSHTHTISAVTGLQSALDSKAPASGAVFSGFTSIQSTDGSEMFELVASGIPERYFRITNQGGMTLNRGGSSSSAGINIKTAGLYGAAGGYIAFSTKDVERMRIAGDGAISLAAPLSGTSATFTSAIYIPSEGLTSGQKVRLKFKTS